MLAPAHVREQVVGGLTATDEPVNVTFVRTSTAQDLIFGAEPQLDPSYDGGYWLQTIGLEAWRVGATDVATFTVLLPRGPIAAIFDAMGMIDFVDGGSYQDQLSCGIL